MSKPVSRPGPAPAAGRPRAEGVRLYVARGTPNSNRAELNLDLALKLMDGAGAGLPVEVVDVFSDPKRALKDGIIVTPTLIGFCAATREIMMGDLTDTAKLTLLLQAALSSISAPP